MRELSLIVNCYSNNLNKYKGGLVRKAAYKKDHTICFVPEDKRNRYIGYARSIDSIVHRVNLKICKVS